MCARCDIYSVAWLQPFLDVEGGAQNLLFCKHHWYTSGKVPLHSGIGDRRTTPSTPTRLPPHPLSVDEAGESAPESPACNPPMPVGAVGASREGAFVSAACISPPVPRSENNFV